MYIFAVNFYNGNNMNMAMLGNLAINWFIFLPMITQVRDIAHLTKEKIKYLTKNILNRGT